MINKAILIIAAGAVSTTAFAQAGGPIRKRDKCWAATDSRGYGFWDHCAERKDLDKTEAKHQGYPEYGHARSTVGGYSGAGDSGGGGGGGGGGGK